MAINCHADADGFVLIASQRNRMKVPKQLKWIFGLVLLMAIAAIVARLGVRWPTPAQLTKPSTAAATASPPATAAQTPMMAANQTAGSGTKGGFQLRPFPVAYESPHFEWTLANGMDTNVIRELAHNDLEYARMVEENPRIFRRRLVYLKQTAAAVFEQAKLTGSAVQQLTLPGIDQELRFQIVKGDPGGSSRRGMFSGHLAGNPDSLVTLAFQDGREAFTVLSPKDNLYIVGEPREDGQVIVKAIDPNTYGVGPEAAQDVVSPAAGNH
ncbi:MAG TPA: hypothetical protein VFV81_08875 [Verrucomicrobiae bacterium]|nr:hypothetical protein [Verrucomicrobiae bacterium]